MSVVLDASATIASSFPEEQTPSIRQVFAQVQADGAWVPNLWRLEVGNTLELAVRKGRHSAEARAAKLFILDGLPIEVDPLTDAHAWGTILRLAIKHRLTVYDACYLELALRRSLPLATLDKEIRLAARAENVPLLGAE